EESGEHPRHVSTAFASVQFLSMLGAKPQLGRVFSGNDSRQEGNHVAVISDGYFQSRFHRDKDVLGKTITLGGTMYTIVGVLPPKFHLPATMEGLDQLKPDVWVPLSGFWKTP